MRWFIDTFILILLGFACSSCSLRSAEINSLESSTGLSSQGIILDERFLSLDPNLWKEFSLKRKTFYSLEKTNDQSFLKAFSKDSASILLCGIKYESQEYPWLSWRWMVEKPVEGEDLSKKSGSDAPARIYVYFDTGRFFWQKRSIDYVWSVNFENEVIMSSPFSRNSKIIVLDGGKDKLGVWSSIKRNVFDDYQRCFQEKPPGVVAIGIMTDTDTTGKEATAYYDDFVVSKAKP